MTTPTTLEQIAAQTAEKIWRAIIMHRLTLPEDTDLDLKPLIFTALQTATAQQAPTQGGDWAEAAARACLRDQTGCEQEADVLAFAAIIRRHAPQPDLASVRTILETHIGTARPGDRMLVDHLMSALTPASLGALKHCASALRRRRKPPSKSSRIIRLIGPARSSWQD